MSKKYAANFDKFRQNFDKLDIWKETSESEETSVANDTKKMLGKTGLHALDASQKIFDLIETTKQEAIIDGLTKCFNRSYFEKFKKEKFNPKFDDRIVGLVFVDLDNFKAINDTLGHKTGDEVLVRIADLIKSKFRVQRWDNVFRIGGDEFAVICRNHEINENFENVLNQKLQELQESTDIAFSYGVAVFDKNQDINLDSTTERADFNMYKNKEEKDSREQTLHQQ